MDARGRRKASLPPDFAGGEVEIRRGDLSRVLYEASRDTTEYLFGDHITSLTETPGGVDVTFKHAPARTFDLVIGADGMHSGVRALAFGEEARFSRFMGAYFASFSAGPLEREGELVTYNAPGRFVSAGLLVFRTEQLLDYDRQDVEVQKRIVAGAYTGAGWRTGEIIEAMLAAPDFYLDSISQIRMEQFTDGRVALLGDAGHGATIGGMGTGLGIVGAYVLAGELAAAGGDHRVAFPRYQELMRPYAWGSMGNAGKFLAPRGKRGILLRNQMVKLMSCGPVIKMMGRMDMKVASNITLPDYEG
ncbi:MAG TPA: FAD-dependent oxidoreductase [Actinophytocola sp.]|uniref:FAD-dependent oxidoreductase n=1 Tax=Actinophytocola sp. TaxID=1872138 RepID=UPI002DF8F1A4|nr:FAD-dependent oxidoreductase [Actinophytocola sp.]